MHTKICVALGNAEAIQVLIFPVLEYMIPIPPPETLKFLLIGDPSYRVFGFLRPLPIA